MKKPYCCPKCKKDLRENGVFLTEHGSADHHLWFNKEGKNDQAEMVCSQTDEYVVRCADCETILDIELKDVWDTLPKNIKELKNA